MFSLFYGLWKYVFAKDEFRVLILGVDRAGKTVAASFQPSYIYISLSELEIDDTYLYTMFLEPLP